MAMLDQIRSERGVGPTFLRMDNAPEFIADTLRDWCKEGKLQANYCNPMDSFEQLVANTAHEFTPVYARLREMPTFAKAT